VDKVKVRAARLPTLPGYLADSDNWVVGNKKTLPTLPG